MSAMDVLTQILFGFNNPAFTSFSLSGNTTLEVGASIPATKTFTWAATYMANIKPNSTIIRNITDAVTLFSNITIGNPSGTGTSGSYSGSSAVLTKNSPTSVVFRISQENTRDVVFTRDYSVNWLWPIY